MLAGTVGCTVILVACGGAPTARPAKSTTYSVVNGASSLGNVTTNSQQNRRDLQPGVANEALLLASWNQPGGKGQVAENVDHSLAVEALDRLLDNITYMDETGDFGPMSSTFYASKPGATDPQDFPTSSVDVNGIENVTWPSNKANQAKNPNQPISASRLEYLDRIEIPKQINGDYAMVDLYGPVANITYGSPDASTMTVQRNVQYVYMKYTLAQVDAPVTRSDGTTVPNDTQRIWVIFQETPMGLRCPRPGADGTTTLGTC